METFQGILSWIGALAALLTSLSYVAQVRKALSCGSTEDFSLKTSGILTTGLLVWIIYAVLKADWVIVADNGVGAALSATGLTGHAIDLKVRRRPVRLFSHETHLVSRLIESRSVSWRRAGDGPLAA